MKNNMKKIIITAFIFMFFVSPQAEASRFDFGKNILKRQKASVISSENSPDCERVDKISENLSEKINSVSSEKDLILIEKTSKLQEAWAKEDSAVYEKRNNISASIKEKFNKLENKVPEEKLIDLQVFESKIFSAIEKRNSAISTANEEYREAIISYLSEYGSKKETSLSSFEKNVRGKIAETKSLCQKKEDFSMGDIEKVIKNERKNVENNLAGDHFREFIETKRAERDQELLKIKETFDKEIQDAREDFTDF